MNTRNPFGDYGMSIGDMMSSLMLIFLLIALAFMENMQRASQRAGATTQKEMPLEATSGPSKVEVIRDFPNGRWILYHSAAEVSSGIFKQGSGELTGDLKTSIKTVLAPEIKQLMRLPQQAIEQITITAYCDPKDYPSSGQGDNTSLGFTRSLMSYRYLLSEEKDKIRTADKILADMQERPDGGAFSEYHWAKTRLVPASGGARNFSYKGGSAVLEADLPTSRRLEVQVSFTPGFLRVPEQFRDWDCLGRDVPLMQGIHTHQGMIGMEISYSQGPLDMSRFKVKRAEALRKAKATALPKEMKPLVSMLCPPVNWSKDWKLPAFTSETDDAYANAARCRQFLTELLGVDQIIPDDLNAADAAWKKSQNLRSWSAAEPMTHYLYHEPVCLGPLGIVEGEPTHLYVLAFATATPKDGGPARVVYPWAFAYVELF